jgi:hypothetical protein
VRDTESVIAEMLGEVQHVTAVVEIWATSKEQRTRIEQVTVPVTQVDRDAAECGGCLKKRRLRRGRWPAGEIAARYGVRVSTECTG